MSDELVKMKRIDPSTGVADLLDVHPTCVNAHVAVGFHVLTAREVAAMEAAEADAETTKAGKKK